MRRVVGLALVLAVAMALAAAMSACGERVPVEHVFDLELQGGELVDGGDAWQVKQDDKVTLIVRSDQPVNFHFHGYNLEQDITPEQPAEIVFTAEATGSFPITFHLATPGMTMGDDAMAMDDHGSMGGIEGPQGMDVSIQAVPDSVSGMNVRLTTANFAFAPQEVGGVHVPGHGHAHIYLDGVKVGRLYGEHYHLGSIGPGEHRLRATLNANTHEEYAIGGAIVEDSITVVVPDAGDEGGGHGHGDEGETQQAEVVEKELGRFEVRP